MRWVRRWSITITWIKAEHSPWNSRTYQVIVDTPAELRRLVEAARRDRNVVSLPYQSIRSLDGDMPTQCRAGHEYPKGYSFGASRFRQWLTCFCGGHHAMTCPECGDRVLEPPPEDTCDRAVWQWLRPAPTGEGVGLAPHTTPHHPYQTPSPGRTNPDRTAPGIIRDEARSLTTQQVRRW